MLLIGVVCLGRRAVFGPAKTNPASDATQSVEFAPAGDCHKLPRSSIVPATIVIQTRRAGPGTLTYAPVSWFVIGHVNEGRENVNLSGVGQVRTARC